MMNHAVRDLIAQHEQDADPLNIYPELAATRALFQDFIDRYNLWRDALLAWHASFSNEWGEGMERPEKPRQLLDISDAYRMLSEATKIVERIEKIRSEDAVSRKDLLRIMAEMGRAVERYVVDEPTREKIKDHWMGICIA